MVLKANSKDIDLLARLMRAEAVGDGDLGMLMVGNVVINRALARCLTFNDVIDIDDVVYQNPGGFAGINSPLFVTASNGKERQLAARVLNGQVFHPATNALWFYAPKEGENCKATWWDQKLAGRYKGHCFYIPAPGVCDGSQKTA